jgi:hypothetical protein
MAVFVGGANKPLESDSFVLGFLYTDFTVWAGFYPFITDLYMVTVSQEALRNSRLARVKSKPGQGINEGIGRWTCYGTGLSGNISGGAYQSAGAIPVVTWPALTVTGIGLWSIHETDNPHGTAWV